jgi:alpha-glucosidase (family GH31 glycosyl hydrolase)
MRAMWLHYSNDPQVLNMGSQYLWGRDMLIAPVFEKGATTRKVYLPKGDWYDWWSGEKQSGGQTVSRNVDLTIMPIYVRAGAIIPFDPIRQYVDQPVNEPTTLRIYAGADGDFTLYEDDGISQDYTKGKGSWTRITWSDKGKKLTLAPQAPKGAINEVKQRTFNVLLLPQGTTKEITYNGKAVSLGF